MMTYRELVESRYSVRKFDGRPVEEEKIRRILEAGRVAPTACNRQPQHVYVLRSPEALDRLQKCKTGHFGETLALLVCTRTDECWIREYDGASSAQVDGAIVATHMMLAAWDEGIGSTWVMHFMPEAVKAEFALPENELPVCILVMGYPAPDCPIHPNHTKKKPAAATVTEL